MTGSTLDAIGQDASDAAFPTDALEGCRDALLLFGAGFLGVNDGWWVADAGLLATVVDLDGGKLELMRAVYPPDWVFVEADAFEFARRGLGVGGFDFVSVDCFTNLAEQVLAELPLWLRLARKALIVTVTADVFAELSAIRVPEGWRVEPLMQRSRTVYWLILRRDP